MSYILHILTPYRYQILAALSLLLIAEMALAGVNLVPIEYEWALGCLMLLTIVAWAGIAVVIGVAAPAGGDVPKDVPNPNIYVPDFSVGEIGVVAPRAPSARVMLIRSPSLFAMFFFLSVFGAILFQSQFLLDVFWQPYSLVLIMAWMGMVVIVGASSNIEHSRKTYLFGSIFPLLISAWTLLFWTTLSFTDEVLDLPTRLLGANLADLVIPIGALFIVLSTSLVIGAVLRRSAMVDSRRIVVAITAFGISIFSFFSALGIGVMLYIFSAGGSTDAPGAALGIFVSMPILWSLTICVFGMVLIGMMRRRIRNITVAGIGMAAMILVFGWYWYVTMDTGHDTIPVEERISAERNWNRYGPSCPSGTLGWRAIKVDDGKFLARGYTFWRLPTGDCH